MKELSDNGNEVCFCTIGDASTSEGHFWETINAAGVLQVPMVVFVWDDGYGISVPRKYQTTKGSISEALAGMRKEEDTNGIAIFNVKGWDYAGMCETFDEGIRLARETHTPVLFHVEEITQPQGHSTSGSHERYKTQERLAWEREWDGLKKMREWILENSLANEDEVEEVEHGAKREVKASRDLAWQNYLAPIKIQVDKACQLLSDLANTLPEASADLQMIVQALRVNREPLRRDVMKALNDAIDIAGDNDAAFWTRDFYKDLQEENERLYNSHLYNEGPRSALRLLSA